MAAGRKVLLVDDDAAMRGSLAEQLRLHGELAVAEAGTAYEAFEIAKRETFDAIVLDVVLPDMDGRELCRLMRRNGIRVPILMLTAAAGDADVILGLDCGANDYVTKPFRLNVLLARIRVQIRQRDMSEDAEFTIGPYKFRPGAKLLIDETCRRKLRLTEKETDILACLYRAGDQVIDRDTLLKEVWGASEAVAAHTIESHVYRLRQKIERDPQKAVILVTEPGGGYRLVP